MMLNMNELDKAIRKVEGVVQDYNHIEKDIILNSVLNRSRQAVAQAKRGDVVNDVMGKMNMKNIFKKIKDQDGGAV